MVPELDRYLVASKNFDQLSKTASRRPRAFFSQGSIERPFSTTRECKDLAAVALSEIDEMHRACSLDPTR
jgi:hypothetical protein